MSFINPYRFNSLDKYKLRFVETNQDYIDFGAGMWIEDFDNFEIEVKYSNLSTTTLGLNVLLGQANTNGTGRWRLIYNNVGKIEFSISGGGSISDPSPSPTSGTVKITSVSNQVKLFIDDIELASSTFTSVTPTSENRLLIGAYGDGAVNIYDYGNSDIHWARINDNVLNLEEGFGNVVKWSFGNVGTIYTSNIEDYDYIDKTMWAGQTVYSLNFDNSYEDWIDFGTGKSWLSGFYWEVSVKVSNTDNTQGKIEGIIGQTIAAGTNGRWGIYIDVNGNIIAYVDPSANILINGPLLEDGIIKFTRAGSLFTLYLNDVNVGSVISSNTFNSSPNWKMFVGAYGSTNAITPYPNYYFTGRIHWAEINVLGVKNRLELDEGVGKTVSWSGGEIGEIKTSNNSGLNYINNTMWKDEHVYDLDFMSTNHDLIDNGLQFSDSNINRLKWEIEFSYSNFVWAPQKNIFGAWNWESNSGKKWGLMTTNGTDQVQFVIDQLSVNAPLTIVVSNFPSSGTVKLTYDQSGDDMVHMFIDDVEVGVSAAAHVNGLTFTSPNEFRIAAGKNTFGGATEDPTKWSSFTMYWMRINDNWLSLTEGIGDTITWTGGETGTISTDNIDGIDYINSIMWGAPQEFIIKIETTVVSELITLPVSGGAFNATVDWGDGTIDSSNTHEYATPGIYDISILGTVTSFAVNNGSFAPYPIEIVDWGFSNLETVNFYGCTNLTTVAADTTYAFSTVTSFSQLFRSTGITQIPADLFKYATIATNFYAAFYGTTGLLGETIPAGLFDNCVSATSFNSMFYGSDVGGVIPTGLFDYTTEVTNMTAVFYNCNYLTGSIPYELFRYTTKVTSFGAIGNAFYSGAFYQCSGLTGDFPTFEYMPDLEYTSWMFKSCTGLNGTLPTLTNNTKLIGIDGMFYNTGATGSIPFDMISNSPDLTHVGGLFWSCENLTGTIHEDFFRYNTNIISMRDPYYHEGVFGGCTGLTGSIPENLFKYNTQVQWFGGMFSGCSGLTGSIPPDLFKYNTLATEFGNNNGGQRYGVFSACTGLTGDIPEDLFRYNVLANSFIDIFNGCTGLTGVSGTGNLFQYNTNATTFYRAFANSGITTVSSGLFNNCTSATEFGSVFSTSALTAIPAGLFDDCTAALNFSYAFYQTSIPSIPANLFDNCTLMTSLAWTFGYCPITTFPADLFKFNVNMLDWGATFRWSGLTTIPAGAFDYNVATTSFYSTFTGAPITSIPANLFDNCPLVTNFQECFRQCTLITEIPAGLFDYNTLVENFALTFFQCYGLINATNTILHLFDNNVNVTTFGECFNYNSNLVNGDAPDLWNRVPEPVGNACFRSCTFNNQAAIPATWK